VYAGTLNGDGSYTTEGYPLTDLQGRWELENFFCSVYMFLVNSHLDCTTTEEFFIFLLSLLFSEKSPQVAGRPTVSCPRQAR
jgi:hypothetical protein